MMRKKMMKKTAAGTTMSRESPMTVPNSWATTPEPKTTMSPPAASAM
jgi:hypothetical protein